MDTKAIPPSDDDHAGLRRLAQRLLTPVFGPDAPAPQDWQLLVGRVPPDLPIELPLPSGAVTLGSQTGPRVTVALDAPQDAPAIAAFYRERMGALGWTEAEFPGAGRGGFAHASPFGDARLAFYATPSGPSLTVMIRPTEQTPTDLRLEFNPDAHQRNTPFSVRRQMGRNVLSLLPTLTAPPRSRQMGGGGGGGGDQVHTSAQLIAPLDIAAVAQHYDAQLEAAGWRTLERGAHAPVAWSAWTFTATPEGQTEREEWRGFLLIFRQPEAPDHYFLTLQAERADGDRGGMSWSSSTFGPSH